MGHDYLKSALSRQTFLGASHASSCIVLNGSVLFFTWHLLPWRFVSQTSPLLFSSVLVVAVSDAVTSVASGPMRPLGKWWSCCLETLQWNPGAVEPLQGLRPPAALPSSLASSLFFSSFCQATDSFAALPSSCVHGPSVAGVVPKVSCSCSAISKAKCLFLNALLASNLLLLLFGQSCQMWCLCCSADSKWAE